MPSGGRSNWLTHFFKALCPVRCSCSLLLCRMRQKPKVDIVLVKTIEFEELMAASQDASLLPDEDVEWRPGSRHSSSSLGGDQQALKDSPTSSGEPALPGAGGADGPSGLPGDDGRPQLAPRGSPPSSDIPALPGDGSEEGSPELPPEGLPSSGSSDLPGGNGRDDQALQSGSRPQTDCSSPPGAQ